MVKLGNCFPFEANLKKKIHADNEIIGRKISAFNTVCPKNILEIVKLSRNFFLMLIVTMKQCNVSPVLKKIYTNRSIYTHSTCPCYE